MIMNKTLPFFSLPTVLVLVFGAFFYFITVEDPFFKNEKSATSKILPDPSMKIKIEDIVREEAPLQPESVIQPLPQPPENLSEKKEAPRVSSPRKIEDSITQVVSIEAAGFNPRVITIHSGDTVRWVNNDGNLHWPASDPHPTHTGFSGFDPLADLRSGENYSFTFSQPGIFGYHDHTQAVVGGVATMTGIIRVLER